jgi:hypothetical protein
MSLQCTHNQGGRTSPVSSAARKKGGGANPEQKANSNNYAAEGRQNQPCVARKKSGGTSKAVGPDLRLPRQKKRVVTKEIHKVALR